MCNTMTVMSNQSDEIVINRRDNIYILQSRT